MPDTFPTDPDCVFCRIVAGDIPCHRVYEDGHVLAFLDVGPLSRGHCLVIPKGHWETLDRVPGEVAAAIGAVLPRLARAVCAATGTAAYNVLQNNGAAANQAVMHVHFHIIPKFNGDGLQLAWNPQDLEDPEPLRDAIVAAMGEDGG